MALRVTTGIEHLRLDLDDLVRRLTARL